MIRLFSLHPGPGSRRQKGKRAREGSTAVEFAMIALPFFVLLFGILEIGLLLLLDAVVETAVSDAGRLVRTGQAQQQTLTADDIKQKLCGNMSVFAADCPNRAFIDVQVVDSFNDPVAPDPLASGVFDQSKLVYKPGGPGDRVLVRIWYEQPIITPFIAQALSRTSDHKVYLTTSLAFRNEPYQ